MIEPGIYNAVALQTFRGFNKRRKYVLNIKHPPNSCYEVYNVEDPEMYFTTASEISLKQKFDILTGEE